QRRGGRPQALSRRDRRRRRGRGHDLRGGRAVGDPVRGHRAGKFDRGRAVGLRREILEGVRQIEREKGIEDETLVRALEDALLAAYKKTPGAARHATVELDQASGDFRVWSIELPPDIEERLMDEAGERAISELEAAEEESGERSHTLVTDEDLLIDWSDVPDEQVKRADVTPANFG